ncbi:MAG TPA: hypothetical protein VIV82_09450, partial [Verrucomicrobiae bacterium]
EAEVIHAAITAMRVSCAMFIYSMSQNKNVDVVLNSAVFDFLRDFSAFAPWPHCVFALNFPSADGDFQLPRD